MWRKQIGIFAAGQAVVELYKSDYGYCGTIYTSKTRNARDRLTWCFDGLEEPIYGEANDKDMVKVACFFGSLYCSEDIRGELVPTWAPEPEVADMIKSSIKNATGVYELDKLPEWCSDMYF